MAILFTGDVSNYDDVSDFIDRNELPLLINYDNREACMHSITHDQLSREVFNNPRIKNQLVFFLNSQDSEYPSMRSQCLQVLLFHLSHCRRHGNYRDERPVCTRSVAIRNG